MLSKVIMSWLNFRLDFQEILNISYANHTGEHAWSETRTLAVHKLFLVDVGYKLTVVVIKYSFSLHII